MLRQGASPLTVVRSKIEPPLLTGGWVRRRRLEARLDRSLARSLTVITAPAGHGKTSSIVTWLRLRGLDAAWLTVDDRDADFTRFATHLAAALDRVVPGIALGLFALLTVPDRLAPHDLGEAFGEALYDLDRDALLVLDDAHAAGDGAVAALVAGLLQAAPRRLHTMLSSRGALPLPLSRLRIAGDVEELTGADLRFSPRETSELLSLETGEAVDPDVAAKLQAAVGGWPAAIRLFAISHGASGATTPLKETQERHEHLLHGYLGEEVLSRLPAWQRELLLRLSLLERFNLPLLETLAADLDAGRVSRPEFQRLRELELFREIPGLSETWFAYHPLFKEVLARELAQTTSAQAIAALRRRAARWFAQAGLTLEAVQQLVAVGDIASAATLIEERASGAFTAEDWQSVAAWLRLIPMAVIRLRPELLLASAWVAYLGGREPRITEILQAMRDPDFQHLATDAQRAEILLLAESVDGEPERWVAIAERAIALIPRPSATATATPIWCWAWR